MHVRDEHSDRVEVAGQKDIDAVVYEKKAPAMRRQQSTIFFTQGNELVEKYFPSEQPAAEGAFGHVRFFVGNQGHEIAVKSPVGEFKDPQNFDGVNIIKSCKFFNKVYPDYVGTLHIWKTTFRQVMPKLPGAILFEKIETCSEAEYVDMLLAIASELNRLHSLGIIHGDIKPNNILIDDSVYPVRAYLIDFDFSYDIDGYATTTTIKGCTYWAPERRECIELKANVAQDIYSFSVLFDSCHRNAPYMQASLSSGLSDFLDQYRLDASSKDSTQRPSLDLFINQLQDIKMRASHAIEPKP